MIVLSCSKLEEQSEYLEYDNYMKNGWIAFQASDWEIAADLFNIGLNQVSSNYSEAYSGLGWTYLYQANKLYGESNRTIRETLRTMAENSFINAEKEEKYDWDIWSDILVGNAYIYSYKADKALYTFYNDNDFQNDSSFYFLMLDFSDLTISKTDSLIAFDIEYDFQFDPCLNLDNVRYLRAKTFLRLNKIEDMLIELNSINTYSCSGIDTLVNIDQGIDCLNNLSNLLTNCH